MGAYGIVDCQARHAAFPDSFAVPNRTLLDALAPGRLVKVIVEFPPALDPRTGRTASGERFWVLLTEVSADRLAGTIDNDLAHTPQHGLRSGDVIAFEARHVAAVYIDPA
jgi:hypothetical protein